MIRYVVFVRMVRQCSICYICAFQTTNYCVKLFIVTIVPVCLF